MATFDQHLQQVVGPQYNADHIATYQQAMPRPVDPETLADAGRRLAALPLETISDPTLLPLDSRMRLRGNPLFVGREVDLLALDYTQKVQGFAKAIEILTLHVMSVANWLGRHWHRLLGVIGVAV
jgi:hypothetical protein